MWFRLFIIFRGKDGFLNGIFDHFEIGFVDFLMQNFEIFAQREFLDFERKLNFKQVKMRENLSMKQVQKFFVDIKKFFKTGS